MTAGEMLDPTGKIIVELRSSAAVGALVGTRVGGPSQAVGWTGSAFLVVRRLGPIRRLPRLAVARFRISVDAYGRTEQEAAAVYGAASDVLSARGPRRSAGGVAIYLSIEEAGGQAGLDPDNKMPFERSIYTYSAPLAQASS